MPTKQEWPIKFSKISAKRPQTKRKNRKSKPKRQREKSVQFPPPFKISGKLIDKLAQRYQVHENPDPSPCPHCGMKYKDLRTGLNFSAVRDMLWIGDTDPIRWRYKRRGSVLGLWFEIKRSMWTDHIELCGSPEAQADWLEDFSPEDFDYDAPLDYDAPPF